ncbi:MAG TPA: MauE/DoxX family redox-associated membrane protein [Pseudonocardiaceae bacterium]|nr:MauE/DoxX family redox-associated membrane protein [Pseudonocardiaceae bacterium]
MIVLAVPVLAGAFLLVEAGLEHLRAPKQLARAAGTSIAAARAIAVVEFVIGAPSVVAVVWGINELRWALAAQFMIYLAFAAHLMWRRHRGDDSDCGCNQMGTQVGPGGIGRAVVLAIATLAATALYPAAVLPDGGTAILLIACAVVLAVLLYTLPAAVDGRAA